MSVISRAYRVVLPISSGLPPSFRTLLVRTEVRAWRLLSLSLLGLFALALTRNRVLGVQVPVPLMLGLAAFVIVIAVSGAVLGLRWFHRDAAIVVFEREELRRLHAERAGMDAALLVSRTAAHQLNNTLAPVVGYAELLALRPAMTGDPGAVTMLTAISTAGLQAADAIRRLEVAVRATTPRTFATPAGPILDLATS